MRCGWVPYREAWILKFQSPSLEVCVGGGFAVIEMCLGPLQKSFDSTFSEPQACSVRFLLDTELAVIEVWLRPQQKTLDSLFTEPQPCSLELAVIEMWLGSPQKTLDSEIAEPQACSWPGNQR